MREIIWSGQAFMNGLNEKGVPARVVRDEKGDLFWEFSARHDSMGGAVWDPAEEPFVEFLIAAGNLMHANQRRINEPSRAPGGGGPHGPWVHVVVDGIQVNGIRADARIEVEAPRNGLYLMVVDEQRVEVTRIPVPTAVQ